MEVILKLDENKDNVKDFVSLLKKSVDTYISDLPLEFKLISNGIHIKKISDPEFEIDAECSNPVNFYEEIREIGNELYEESEIDDLARCYGECYEDGSYICPDGISITIKAVYDPYKDDWYEYDAFYLDDCIEAFGIEDVVMNVNQVIEFVSIDSFDYIGQDETNKTTLYKLNIGIL